MRHLFIASALCTSLCLCPMAAAAQSWDRTRLNDEVLNSAANYTNVLRTSHAEVRRYINWRGWRPGMNAEQQEARTSAILTSIDASETINATLVPTLTPATLESYGVRFRYCDGKLLSYFGTPDFKHNLTGAQIAEAPVLRAERRGKRYAGRPVGVVEAGSDGMVLAFSNGRQMRIPDCLIKGAYPTSLATGTVAYLSSALQKYGVARTRRTREKQKVACPVGEVGLGQTERRYLRTDYSAQGNQIGTPYYDTSEGGDGNWTVTADFCREPGTVRKRDVQPCDAVIRGPNRTMTVPGKGRAVYDYYVTEAQDPTDFTKVVWLPSDAEGNYTTNVTGTLSQLSNCDNLAPTATVTPVVSTAMETQTLGCAEPWTHGGRDYQRSVTNTTYTYSGMKPGWENGLSASNVNLVRRGDWALTDNSCRRWVFSSAMQQKSTDCSCRGKVTHQRAVTTKGWDWQARADTITTTHGHWNRVSGSCEPAWKVERQGGSCNNNSSPNSGNDGGPEGREDNDGDGVNDAQDRDDGDPTVD
ncbi:hypothetical protein [uncultured Ruegeria sp.]|uniref:hypothetical protein n=1 Tax=uncultured Ruegeria sp. TaxID=259304 RepID=UPI0026235DD0|nr:hypothetical protein [uncultured Ruegeria sp.]